MILPKIVVWRVSERPEVMISAPFHWPVKNFKGTKKHSGLNQDKLLKKIMLKNQSTVPEIMITFTPLIPDGHAHIYRLFAPSIAGFNGPCIFRIYFHRVIYDWTNRWTCSKKYELIYQLTTIFCIAELKILPEAYWMFIKDDIRKRAQI